MSNSNDVNGNKQMHDKRAFKRKFCLGDVEIVKTFVGEKPLKRVIYTQDFCDYYLLKTKKKLRKMGGYIESADCLSQTDLSVVTDSAKVMGQSQVTNNAIVSGDAEILNSVVKGFAVVSDCAYIFNSHIDDCAYVGRATVYHSTIKGNAFIVSVGEYFNCDIGGDMRIVGPVDLKDITTNVDAVISSGYYVNQNQFNKAIEQYYQECDEEYLLQK